MRRSNVYFSSILVAAVTAVLVLASRASAQVYRPSGKPIGPDKVADEVEGSRVMLYGDKLATEYIPGGWMPDGRGLAQDVSCKDNPHGGKYCIRAKYRLALNSWVGIGWLWLNKFEGHNRRPPDMFSQLKAHKGDRIVLRFWARSSDRAWLKCQAGGGGNGDSISFAVNTSPVWIRLTPEWKRYEIDLSKEDLTGVIQIFGVFLDRAHNEEIGETVTFDLDDVYLVKLKD